MERERERERESERLSKRKIVIFFRPSVSLIGEQVKVVKMDALKQKEGEQIPFLNKMLTFLDF